MFKKLFFLTALFFLHTKVAFGYDPTVLVINQVRGNESCCLPGNSDLLIAINNDPDLNALPIGWALRYDVLENQKLTSIIPKSGEFGLLLEITPKLASDSGVVYKGNISGDDWYYAKNAFLVGYTRDERKKLLDKVFGKFKNTFEYYPKFTIAWMIDAWSLNYIHDKYGVGLHELTKEQVETDSYTLYGGIFNAPYYPSKKHPLIPGYEDQLDLIIIRQTISDLIYNYGSSKAYFTSQPNDYLENPKKASSEYFQQLVNDSINQNTHKFAVIGFENSYPWKTYGNEYLNQLSFIKKLQQNGKIKVKKPTDFTNDFRKEQSKNSPFFLEKQFNSNSKEGVLWYFGKTYRARVMYKDEKLILDDLRLYSSITDPYYQTAAVSDYAYWIVPYLIDSSSQLSFDKHFGIVLGEKKFKFIASNNAVNIEIDGSKKGIVTFEPDDIAIDRSLSPYLNITNPVTLQSLFDDSKRKKIVFDKNLDLVIDSSKDNINLGYFNNSKTTYLFKLENKSNYFNLIPLQENNLENLTPIFQPDRSILPVDSQKSIYYWNNTKAIAGRNPVRLFILPLNTIGRPTNVSKVEVLINQPDNIKIIYPDDYSFRVTPWFIDLFSDKPTNTTVSVLIDGVSVIENKSIEFIPNCRKEMNKCLTSVKMVIQYTVTILTEKKNQLLARIDNL